MSNATTTPTEALSKRAWVSSMDQYKKMYDQSIKDPDKYWDRVAKEQLDFFTPYTRVQSGTFETGDVAWYLNGKLNVSYNAIDRHLPKRAKQVALIFEGDIETDIQHVTYQQLYNDVCRLANLLKSLGVKKGDSVCIYLPMTPSIAIAMLACARIGAPHSVVFAGFSKDALRDRIRDGNAKVVITADGAMRSEKLIPLKETVDAALLECPDVHHVIVHRCMGRTVNFEEPRDLWMEDAMLKQRPYCPPEHMDSEDTLFMLYTSGSTGLPKGIAHTTAGYAVWASYTHKYVFDYHDGDIYACVADCGWITGHSYIVYGPLINGATTFMFQGSPLSPDPGRYWRMVERHKFNVFYTAPTAIRALMRFGNEHVDKYDLSSLRILGSVGEPINRASWEWYHNVVGRGKCSIVDTYWQTETGGIMITPLPGCTPTKPGSATFPFFGVKLAIRDAQTGAILNEKGASGVLTVDHPWPGMCRTVFGDHQRYLMTYMSAYEGAYFTGDGATRDEDGYIFITGRCDDVLNVSGHRIGSAEIESAIVSHKSIAEAAVVGRPHSIKGTSLFAYVTPKNNISTSDELIKEMQLLVREKVGAFAKPDEVVVTAALPKTRSGKIMRRLLRKIASREFDPNGFGDTSTLLDPSVVDSLIETVKKMVADNLG